MSGLQCKWAVLFRRLWQRLGRLLGFLTRLGKWNESKPAQPGPDSAPWQAHSTVCSPAPTEPEPADALSDELPAPPCEESSLEDRLRDVPPPPRAGSEEEWSAWASELAHRIADEEEHPLQPLSDVSRGQMLVWVPARLVSAVVVAVLLLLAWGTWQLRHRWTQRDRIAPRSSTLVQHQPSAFSGESSPANTAAVEFFPASKSALLWRGQTVPLPSDRSVPLLAVAVPAKRSLNHLPQTPSQSLRWQLAPGGQAVVRMQPWTSTRAWWLAVQQQADPAGEGAAWDFLTAVVARGESASAAAWLPWSTAAWHDQPRVWYELGSDPLDPQARWLLVVVQAPAPAPQDDRPQELVVVVAPSVQFRSSYSFFALSEELAHMAARVRPADRLLVVGNEGRLQLRLGELARCGSVLAELKRLRGQTPQQLRRSLQQAVLALGKRGSRASAERRLVIVTDLPWWTASAAEALAWAKKWGVPLRGVRQVSLVRPQGKPPAGDGWPLVAGLWRARRCAWEDAEHLRQVFWEASGGSFGPPVRLGLELGWYGQRVSWIELPRPGAVRRSVSKSLWLKAVPPGSLMAVMIRLGTRKSAPLGGSPKHRTGPLLGWIQLTWQVESAAEQTLRRPVGAPAFSAFRYRSPLFRVAWLSVHATAGGARPPVPVRRIAQPSGSMPEVPRRWKQLFQLVEKRGPFD